MWDVAGPSGMGATSAAFLSGGVPTLGAALVSAILPHLMPDTPQQEGVDLAMIPTKRNLGVFGARMAEQLRGIANPTSAQTAEAYLSTRYPMRAKLAAGKIEHLPIQETSPSVRGDFDLPTLKVRTYSAPDTPTSNIVGTLSHETQHMADLARRNQSGFTLSDFFPEESGGRYVFSGKTTPEYLNQPLEVRAKQAGRTAARGYLDYLGLKASR